MAEKTASAPATNATVPIAGGPAGIRNVALVGPSAAGKTTLVEALLVASGMLARAGAVATGTTVCDYDGIEVRQQRSVGVAVASLAYDGVKVNLIDTPGYADFVGELRAGLRAADSALFVVAADDAIDEPTVSLWRECGQVGMPRAVVITKLDHPRADYAGTLSAAQATFGGTVLPLYLPAQNGSDEPIGLLWQEPGPASAEAGGDRSALIEAIIEESEDESLMDRYLGGERLDRAVLVRDLEQAVARGVFFPVIPVCGSTGVGAAALLEVVTACLPSPREHALPEAFTPDGVRCPGLACDPDGPLLAEVVKTTSDPYVGRVSLVRVFSGTLRPDATVHVSGHFTSFFGEAGSHPDHDEDERIAALSFPFGKRQRPATTVVAGDICTIGKLTRAETGDTLSDKAEPLLLKPWSMPEPLLPIAVAARTTADEDKLSIGLARLAAEDLSLRIEQNPETHQTVLWCMGEAHCGMVRHRLDDRHGVPVDSVPLRIPLRETVATKANGHGRYVKQSGGHGQYAVCDVEVEPLPPGSGFEFVDKVVGGAVPRQFIPSVEKGIRAQLAKGVTDAAGGYPMVDIRVTLVDGKAHSVDSSDFAFQMAGAAGLREAAAAGGVTLLEPIDTVAVVVPDDLVGAVIGDLSARRSRVLGTDKLSADSTVVNAEVPQAELTRYPIDLRSLSHGTGFFRRTFARYDPLPASGAAHANTAK